ncbi:MAG TPA: FIST N-terminal domain-containing protein [Pirellulales bacterium]|nr:FIST N-terminal domain-containing protein [Pirellulales bacterium]
MCPTRSSGLRFAAALSTLPDARQAAAEACRKASESLAAPVSLAMAFVSPHHAAELESVAAEIGERLSPGCLLGCTGESIVGNGREIEDSPAVALWLAALDGVSIAPMHLRFEKTAEGPTVVGWPDEMPEVWPPGAALLLLGEPFSFPADWLLERLNADRPGVPVVGGMASGAHSPGGNRLLLDGNVFDQGAVAALVHGPVRIETVVSQGCRPIGRTFVVTKAEQNVILELGGKPPLAQLQAVFEELSPEERQLVEQGLHVGRVINEQQGEFQRGDFLVRNCIGADRNTGALAIGDYIRVGQTVQFHVRDARTADEDLRELVRSAKQERSKATQGALLFTCNGRGTRMFEAPDHDAGVLAKLLGDIPLAGFFAQGEIGPIGGKNFVHGFTASAALFSPPGRPAPWAQRNDWMTF